MLRIHFFIQISNFFFEKFFFRNKQSNPSSLAARTPKYSQRRVINCIAHEFYIARKLIYQF